MIKFKDKLIENNNGVKWFLSFVGEKRFGNWLENLNDWVILRIRYWGILFFIWRCECGYIDLVGLRVELVEKVIEDVNLEIVEFYRLYVDDIYLKCEKCGKLMIRVIEVIDCWFDSGVMLFV